MATRRGFLTGMASALCLPSIVRAQGASTLKFAPQSDVAILDPIMSVSYVTRNHALMIFDTLYGADEHNRAQPQMVEGHLAEKEGRVRDHRLRRRPSRWWIALVRAGYPLGVHALLHRWGTRLGRQGRYPERRAPVTEAVEIVLEWLPRLKRSIHFNSCIASRACAQGA